MSTGTFYGRARDSIIFALLGSGTGDDGGLGLGGRVTLTVVAIAAATLVWKAAQFIGLLGAASFYFPAVLIVTLFAGWVFGGAAVATSAALVWALARNQPPLGPLAIFVAAGLLEVLLAGFVRALLREAWRTERALRSLAEQREREAGARELALGEARHRLKNLMAIIEALAKFSGTRPGERPEIDAFLQRFIGRLRALGAASDLVLKYGPGVLEANAVVGAVLEPFLSESPSRLRFEGPELRLSEQFGGALAMAVHELATNALKYGALSVPNGSVIFRWCADGERVEFLWTEQGGPTPKKPERDGYGHRMIRSVAAREADGEVQLDFPRDGLVCRISYRRLVPSGAEELPT